MSALKDFLVEKDYIAHNRECYAFEKYNCADEMIECNERFIQIANERESLVELENIYNKLDLLYDEVYARESLTDREIDIFHDARSAILIPMGLEAFDLEERELTDYELIEGLEAETEEEKAARLRRKADKKAQREAKKQEIRESNKAEAASRNPSSTADKKEEPKKEEPKSETKPSESTAAKSESSGDSSDTSSGATDNKSSSKDVGFLKKLWQSIQRVIASIMNKISGWYVKLFQTSEKLIKKAKAMLNDVDKLKDKKPENSKIKFDMRNIIAKGETFSVGDSKPVTNLKTELKTFVVNKTQLDLAKKFLSSVKGLEVTEDSIKKMQEMMFDDVKKYYELSTTKSGGTVPSVMKGDVGKDITVVKLGELPGNKSLYSFYSSTKTRMDIAKYKLGPNDAEGDLKESIDVEVKSPSDIKTMIDNVISLAEMTENYKKNYDDVKKVKKDILDSGKKFSENLKEGKSLSGEAKSSLSSTVKGFKVYTVILDTPANELNNLNIRYCYSLLSLAGAMLKAYNK